MQLANGSTLCLLSLVDPIKAWLGAVAGPRLDNCCPFNMLAMLYKSRSHVKIPTVRRFLYMLYLYIIYVLFKEYLMRSLSIIKINYACCWSINNKSLQLPECLSALSWCSLQGSRAICIIWVARNGSIFEFLVFHSCNLSERASLLSLHYFCCIQQRQRPSSYISEKHEIRYWSATSQGFFFYIFRWSLRSEFQRGLTNTWFHFNQKLSQDVEPSR